MVITEGAGAEPAQGGHRAGRDPRLPGGALGAAPGRHRPRRSEAVQHHAQAHRQRQARRPRFGLPDDDLPPHRTWTPAYAAPEVHRGETASPRSDLVSLGYVLVELLAGQSPFDGLGDHAELLEAKQTLPDRLPQLLPAELAQNETLMSFCRRLVAPDPEDRFASAEDADLSDCGAASIQRQLVKMDLASEYDNEIRLWLQDLA